MIDFLLIDQPLTAEKSSMSFSLKNLRKINDRKLSGISAITFPPISNAMGILNNCF